MIACFPIFFLERAGERRWPWSPGEAQIPERERATVNLLDLGRKLLSAFLRPVAIFALLYALTCQAMVGMFNSTNPVYFIQELEWDQKFYGWVTGVLASIAGGVGSILGGYLVDRVGVRRIVLGTALLTAAVCATVGVTSYLQLGTAFAASYILTVEFLISVQTVAGFSMFMRLSASVVAGTQYTLFLAASNFTRAQLAPVAGWLGKDGYDAVFLGMGGFALLCLPFLFLIPDKAKAA